MDSAGWDTRYRASDLVWGGEPNRFVAEFTGTPPGRALDLGAGEGRNAIWLAGLGWQVTAVDFFAVAMDRARRLAERQGVTVDWVVADLRDYQPAPGASDRCGHAGAAASAWVRQVGGRWNQRSVSKSGGRPVGPSSPSTAAIASVSVRMPVTLEAAEKLPIRSDRSA